MGFVTYKIGSDQADRRLPVTKRTFSNVHFVTDKRGDSSGLFSSLRRIRVNIPFPDKRDGKNNRVAYRYGTYAEIKLTEYADWGPDEILKRGLKLVVFLQDRWGFKIGDKKEDKISFLGLSFMPKS